LSPESLVGAFFILARPDLAYSVDDVLVFNLWQFWVSNAQKNMPNLGAHSRLHRNIFINEIIFFIFVEMDSFIQASVQSA
jgi:hypothetical protein